MHDAYGMYPTHHHIEGYSDRRGEVFMREEIVDIERELMLIGRYKELASSAAPASERRLERGSSYILLSRLEAEGPMSIGQLAQAFSLDTSTVNRQTAVLLRDGLAERIPD